MYQGHKVLDIHGHMTTPPQFRNFAMTLLTIRSPWTARLNLSDDLLDSAVSRHVRGLDTRNIDVQLLSPRPVAMLQWERFAIQEKWCQTTNDVIAQTCKLYPDRFIGMAQLPQNAQKDSRSLIPELERCVKELGFVGAIVNPDPSGLRDTPGVDEEYWYPLYEKAQEWDVPLMIHPSVTKDPRVNRIPHNYQLNNVWEEYLATLLYVHADVFAVFPRLKVVICHGGGALSRHFQEDMRQGPTRDEIRERFKDNLFFDTCIYDRDFMTATVKQKGVEMMVFGTEQGGAGGEDSEGPGERQASGPEPGERPGRQGRVDPVTGRPGGDVVALIDSLDFLTSEDKIKIFNTNVRRVYTRLQVAEVA